MLAAKSVVRISCVAILAAYGVAEVSYEETTGADAEAVIDASGAVDVRPNTLTYDGLIQPIYVQWCGGCHIGEFPEECSGNTCFVNKYEDLFVQSASKACDTGFNVGECGLYRIEATIDPNDPNDLVGFNGPIILPGDEVELLRTWIVKLGMPKN